MVNTFSFAIYSPFFEGFTISVITTISEHQEVTKQVTMYFNKCNDLILNMKQHISNDETMCFMP